MIEEPIGPTTVSVMYPVPPNTESQRVVNCDLAVETAQGQLIKGARGVDAGPLRKPLMGVALRGPDRRKGNRQTRHRFLSCRSQTDRTRND